MSYLTVFVEKMYSAFYLVCSHYPRMNKHRKHCLSVLHSELFKHQLTFIYPSLLLFHQFSLFLLCTSSGFHLLFCSFCKKHVVLILRAHGQGYPGGRALCSDALLVALSFSDENEMEAKERGVNLSQLNNLGSQRLSGSDSVGGGAEQSCSFIRKTRSYMSIRCLTGTR